MALFSINFVAFLFYFINVSFIQNFVPLRFALFSIVACLLLFFSRLQISCRRLATEDAGVDKIPDYLRIHTKYVNRGKKSFV